MKENIKKLFQNCKKIFTNVYIVAIISSLITIPVWEYGLKPTIEHFSPKPEIGIDLTIVQPYNFISPQIHIRNASIFLASGFGYEKLYVLETKNESTQKLKEIRNFSIVPFKEKSSCTDCIFYSISIINTGKSSFESLIIDILTSKILEISETDPKITKIDCGCIYESMGCRIEINSLGEGKIVNLLLKSRELSNINFECKGNGKYTSCNPNFYLVRWQDVLPMQVMFFNEKVVRIPDLRNETQIKIYEFNPSTNEWNQYY